MLTGDENAVRGAFCPEIEKKRAAGPRAPHFRLPAETFPRVNTNTLTGRGYNNCTVQQHLNFKSRPICFLITAEEEAKTRELI